MKLKVEYFLFLMAFIIKFLLSFVITIDFYFLLINFALISLIIFMLIKKYNIYTYLPIIMIDFFVQVLACFAVYGNDFTSLWIALVHFGFSSAFLYSLIIANVSNLSLNKRIANINIDKGIKALEDKNYDLAIKSFSDAIKDHKKNYLGYMGMCNTLTKMDKYNLKKIAYYKKKCIKYAPKELKDSINNRY